MEQLEPWQNRLIQSDNQPGFWGRGWSFPPTFDWFGATQEMVEGSVDIAESLFLLLSTRPGERKMQPEYGLDLNILLFEPLNLELETQLKDLIRIGILRFEPRVRVNEVHLHPFYAESLIKIEIDYTLITSNTRTNLVYPFYLNEGTDL